MFFASTQYFRGLFGVFADSLPDSFGELLLDRYLKSKNININECNEPLNSKEVQDIDTLFLLGGSIGGARPKSLIKYNGDDYIVKFSAKFDPKNIAELEYKYMSLAKEVGINIPQIKLITSKKGNKYFLIKRFDRENGKRIHMISVAALLEVDFRTPCLDYNELIKLTRVLTRNKEDVIEMYRRMVFNVLIENQDDHAKNFSFI